MKKVLEHKFESRHRRRVIARVGVGSCIDERERSFGIIMRQYRNQLLIDGILPLLYFYPPDARQAHADHQQGEDKEEKEFIGSCFHNRLVDHCSPGIFSIVITR